MTRKRHTLAGLTDEKILGHQTTVFHGLPRSTWEELQEFSKSDIRLQRMLKATNPHIDCPLAYDTPEQKADANKVLHAMAALLPDEAFTYRFDDPMHPGMVVLGLMRSHADYLNDIRAGCMDEQLDTFLMKIRDELKDPAMGEFIKLGARNFAQQTELEKMRKDAIDIINLYHADVVPVPKVEIMNRVTDLHKAVEIWDDGEHLHGPIWVVEFSISQGKLDREEGGRALKAAHAFSHSAQVAETITKALKDLSAGQWRE